MKLTYQQRFGEVNGNSVLTEYGAESIRQMLDEGVSTRIVARRHGVCQTTVMQIKKGMTWQASTSKN